MASSFRALPPEYRTLLVALVDTPPGPSPSASWRPPPGVTQMEGYPARRPSSSIG